MWSFQQPPPSKRLSRGAMAIIPGVFAAFMLLYLSGLGDAIIRSIVKFVQWMGW
jgi:hypothetical protein